MRGQFSDLQVMSNGLLATGARGVLSPSATEPARLYRLSATGTILASSNVAPDSPPTPLGGSLWVVSGPLGPSDHVALTLDELQASTLHTEVRIPLPDTVASGLLLGGAGSMWVLLGPNASSCVVARVVLTAGTARLRPTRTLAGSCVSAAVDTSRTELFVLTGWQSPWMHLYRLSARSGALEASSARLRAITNHSWSITMVASPSRVWIAAGDPGVNGELLYVGARHLGLLNQSTQTGGTLPTYSQYPSVDLSGGRVWVASWGMTSCFRPSNPHQLAGGLAHGPPYVSSSLVVLRHQTFGIAGSGYGAYGIVRVQAPAGCRS